MDLVALEGFTDSASQYLLSTLKDISNSHPVDILKAIPT